MPRIWRRVAAEAIDIAVVTGLTAIFLGDGYFGALNPSGEERDSVLRARGAGGLGPGGVENDSLEWLSFLLVAEMLITQTSIMSAFAAQHITMCLYHTFCTWVTGGTTLGKTIVGTRVVSTSMCLLPCGQVEANSPSLWMSFVRATTKTVSWLCMLVFVASLVEPSGQCLHDKMATTLLIKCGRCDLVILPPGEGIVGTIMAARDRVHLRGGIQPEWLAANQIEADQVDDREQQDEMMR